MKPVRLTILSLSLLALTLFASACVRGERGHDTRAQEATAMAIQITSTAFAPGAAIPARHTCDAEDLSPPLRWSGAPEGAKSLALICDDPDAPAGTWVHWVLYGIPASATELAEGIAKSDTVLGAARQGINDFKRVGYGGPCPPRGKPHRYFFKLYALDIAIDLGPGATRKELLAAMEGHVVAQGELMGTYQRRAE
jgi:hypothetical protein